MNNASNIVVAVVILALITWGPTLLTFRRQRTRGQAVTWPTLVSALLVELTAVIIAVAVVAGLGVSNPGAYLLAIALIVGAVGAQVFSRLGYK